MAQHTGWLKELVIKTKTMKTKAALFDLIIFLFLIQFLFCKVQQRLGQPSGMEGAD